MRLFIALNLPAPLRDAVYADAAPLRAVTNDVKWVAAPLLHVTLKFLGERPDALLPPLQEALTRVAARHRAFEVETTDIGAFPNFRRPRVVWLGITSAPALHALARDVDAALAPIGVEAEQRPFQAHLTLGRVKGGLGIADAAMLAKVASARRPRRGFALHTVDLMRSQLAADGPRYSVLVSAPLQARGT